ncbi:amino acid ABC transporter substrate-binding protein [Anabaena cylindrica FACHB-243]|uniref:Neutral amino acid-binding protein n=1 Tax=Anabaena cylindrica (strain ATCC 27899 / PCC 7122) TaxID=272123 RepID=K9ZLK4_ANACC|nr:MULTISPECIES: amino acid ABC transporter substrate-binding protein [Anabaena]AFZ59422.1 neutral amino acid-binding protein [Anabaena cylindrica PCC 7122]MBD2417577.1 amino acid ABC transporter substrate-binding protein [Anabaena cylindrica FACHB-243]MBY5283231.1 amino acid ABC transporter substrate-binding protein [Anabaena sp. CCAP 1446/1C]MBY5307692.1 amino acid ABC transporter substrate-binding protein [Anabaena sp. CCAP 1446/1C]MCM2405339.1 amino acid ABC transporter substrate-binding p
MRKSAFMLAIAPFLIFALNACGGDSGTTGNTANNPGTQVTRNIANTVKSRGKLICGVSGELPGFSFVGTDGKYSGIDVDICRAVAAALFDNPDAVEFRNLNAKERFTALQTGEIDVLSRNTSWTFSRDTSVGLDFAPVVFYDGQAIMVRKNSGIKTLADLKNKAICAQTGTTTEQNLADQMRKRGVTYKPVVFEDVNITFATYAEGRCDGVTADRSALVSRRTTLPKPEDNVILDELLSSEPLAPAVAKGDTQWSDVVKWVVYSLIKADELGINSQNVAQFATSNDPEIKRFLGTEGNLGEGLGLTNDFAGKIVKHVGNYSEIYDRNLGTQTKLNLPRGQNQLWTKGGLLYSPPFR